jgi:hypothetical protein
LTEAAFNYPLEWPAAAHPRVPDRRAYLVRHCTWRFAAGDLAIDGSETEMNMSRTLRKALASSRHVLYVANP